VENYIDKNKDYKRFFESRPYEIASDIFIDHKIIVRFPKIYFSEIAKFTIM
jgi:hypothetical protein